MGTSQQQPPMNFNSIKVRLELAAKAATYVKPKFQFHKGTIRTREDYFQPEFQDYFNSIKVRLEHTSSVPCCGRNSFQVHKGTIRTGSAPQYVAKYVAFQFHKGTIRTKEDMFTLRYRNISIP